MGHYNGIGDEDDCLLFLPTAAPASSNLSNPAVVVVEVELICIP